LGVAKAVQTGTDLKCAVEYEALLPTVKQGPVCEPLDMKPTTPAFRLASPPLSSVR
jgi:hypothetical protein